MLRVPWRCTHGRRAWEGHTQAAGGKGLARRSQLGRTAETPRTRQQGAVVPGAAGS